MIPIKQLTNESFKKYGSLLEPADKSKVFTVLCGDKDAAGWRIGYVILGPGNVDSLEAHPVSFETFEPVAGTAVILVAQTGSPDVIEAFLLDRGILINKNIWHGLRVISAKAEIKVTENFEVETIHHKLKKPIDVGFV